MTAPAKLFYSTRAAQMAMQSLDRIFAEGIIGMVVAEPGRGKTSAIHAWRKRNPHMRHVWIEADVLTSPRPLLNALAPPLGLTSHFNMYQTKQLICEKLAAEDEPPGIILDEADLLSVRTFDLLRSIWDRVAWLRGTDGERAFPLALFGTPKLRDMLARSDLERLRRRTFHKAELPALSRAELEKVLGKWEGLKVDEEGLVGIMRLSKGSFGWVNNIVAIAMKIASRGEGVVTGRIIDACRPALIGLPYEAIGYR